MPSASRDRDDEQRGGYDGQARADWSADGVLFRSWISRLCSRSVVETTQPLKPPRFLSTRVRTALPSSAGLPAPNVRRREF